MLQERSDKYLWLFDAVFFLVSTVVFESIDWHEFKLTLAIMFQAVRATTNFYSHFPGLQSVILILKREILCRASAAWLCPYCALLTEKERDKGGERGERLLLSCELRGECSVARPVLYDKQRVSWSRWWLVMYLDQALVLCWSQCGPDGKTPRSAASPSGHAHRPSPAFETLNKW